MWKLSSQRGGLCWSPSYCPPTPNSPFYPLLYELQLRPIPAQSSVRLCHQGMRRGSQAREGRDLLFCASSSCQQCPTLLLHRGIDSLLLQQQLELVCSFNTHKNSLIPPNSETPSPARQCSLLRDLQPAPQENPSNSETPTTLPSSASHLMSPP